ncbi:MAG: F0F1 ATP synthase subunit delta [Candidatus Omnitrophica bacterium]|nr:F0F1 ATP synthase subunit delta [Candidatus Omnitrophota bacterium]
MLILNFIIIQIIIFAVIIFVLKKLVLTDTSSALVKLDSARDRVKKEEGELENKINTCEEECVKRKEAAREEAEKIVKDARQKAEEEAAAIIENTKKKAEEMVQKATAAKDKIRNDIMREENIKIVNFASEVFKKAFEKELSESYNEHLAEAFIKELPATDMKYIGSEIDTVQVISPHKLKSELVAKIKDILNKKLKRTLKVEEGIDKKILGGLMLKFGTLVIDGSLLSRVQAVSEEIKKEAEK